jgi:hypothetical protein
MLILFIRKNKKGERSRPKKNDKDSFKKHNEKMKKFRFSHPKAIAMDKDIITADGNVLAMVQTVKLNKHTQN